MRRLVRDVRCHRSFRSSRDLDWLLHLPPLSIKPAKCFSICLVPQMRPREKLITQVTSQIKAKRMYGANISVISHLFSIVSSNTQAQHKTAMLMKIKGNKNMITPNALPFSRRQSNRADLPAERLSGPWWIAPTLDRSATPLRSTSCQQSLF